MGSASVPLAAVASVLRSAGLLEEVRGPEDVAVTGVSSDSRAVAPGDLFLAWKGMDVDAHDYVAAAEAKGAVAAVVERPLDAVGLPQLVVSDGRTAAALAADVVHDSPWRRLFTAAVTGTNGKTTTALIARHLLSRSGPAASVGTLGLVEADGSVRAGTEGLTTPGPVQVSRWLKDLRDAGVRAVTIEASSHALEQRRLDGVRFDAAVFTNLTQDHLDYHHDFARYLAAKARLVELLKDGGIAVVNVEQRAWEGLASGGHPVWTFGITVPARVRAVDLVLGEDGSRFTLDIDGRCGAVRLPLLGRYNVENALGAAAVAAASGLGTEEIAEALASVPQLRGRLEAVRRRPFTVLIDFAHTPDALDGALAAVRPVTRGRLIVVFGAGGDRDSGKRALMAEAARRHADVVILTSDNPRTEDPERILDDLAVGMGEATYERLADRRVAICRALEIARPGDTVLLAGKGHETYQVVGREKRPFDERVVVEECLSALGVA